MVWVVLLLFFLFFDSVGAFQILFRDAWEHTYLGGCIHRHDFMSLGGHVPSSCS